MKTLEQLTKKQLIKLITEIRPKADAYDRVCQELGIENNVIGVLNACLFKWIVDEAYKEYTEKNENKRDSSKGSS